VKGTMVYRGGTKAELAGRGEAWMGKKVARERLGR
jgi:hypothetical protein